MGTQRLFLAGSMAAANVFLAIAIIAVIWRAASGRLQRNQTTGIRIPSTMRSDEAWEAGHRAALRLTPLYLAVLAATLIALVVGAMHASTMAIDLAGIGGAVAWLAVVLFSAIVAGRAAKSAEDATGRG